jgi:hypothetical protein
VFFRIRYADGSRLGYPGASRTRENRTREVLAEDMGLEVLIEKMQVADRLLTVPCSPGALEVAAPVRLLPTLEIPNGKWEVLGIG